MSQFDALLAELNTEVETMAKAMAAPEQGDGDEEEDDGEPGDTRQADAKIAQAAGSEPDGDEGQPADGEVPMGKSLTVEIDGQQVEAVDGTELVKSLMDQLQVIGQKQDAGQTQMAKALEQTLGLVKAQGTLIKSLTESVNTLKAAGRGRKSTVAITDTPAQSMAKAMTPTAPNPGDIMVKALAAQRAGTLSSIDVARVEGSLNAGMAVPAEILSRLS